MKKDHNIYMNRLSTCLIAFTCLLTACNTVIIEQPLQYGTISVALEDEPSLDVQTKAEPVADDFTVRFFDSSDTLKETGEYVNGLSVYLPFGIYYVTAENCTESEAEVGLGKMRLSGKSNPVNLSVDNIDPVVNLECTVANAKVTVKFDTSVKDIFDDLKVVLTGGTEGRRIEVKESPDMTETWFNPSTLGYLISGNIKQATGKAISYSGSRELDSKDNILLLVKLAQGQVEVEIVEPEDDYKVTTDTKDEYINPYN